MSTRDSRSGSLPIPTSPGEEIVREPTQSLNLSPEDQAAAVLALGTHNRPITAIESPAARGKTPVFPQPRSRRADEPADYLGSVLGSYRVIELLGKGGMGYVYRAEHVKLGREVALKLLRSDYASRRDAVTRFFQEARTVNRVRHRNIVDVTDFVELDDGPTYIVMELLTGTSLGAWAQSGVDLARAMAVLIQICDGLGAAHQVGVVHRDLKPDNVVVVPTPDGGELAKLLDFGVAKLLNRDDEDVGFQTAAGSVIGTPAYMSPEQAGGMVIDARSDIYSLGAIMYELFTGQPMFRGRSFGEYVRKHLTEMPIPPHDTPGGGGIDPRLEALILRCIDKDPDQRFAQIAELREALLHLLSESDAAAGLYPPSTGSLSGSGPRARRTPLPPLAPGLPLPPPLSQSSPGVSSAAAGGSPPGPGSGPHRAHSSGPRIASPLSPALDGDDPPTAVAASALGLPRAPGDDPPTAVAASPLGARPRAAGPYASGPHRAHIADAYPGVPAAEAPAPHLLAAFVDPHGATAADPHGASLAAASHASGPHPAVPLAAGTDPAARSDAGPYAAVAPPGAHAAPHPPMTLDGTYNLPPPLTLEGSYRLPPPPAAAATPWWLWFSGGALAVGVGIVAALWFAGRAPDLSSRPAPTSRPAPPTAPPTAAGAAAPTAAATGAAATAAAPAAAPPAAHPALIEVRFDSTPSGSVFADGQPVELCRTPCAFDIDPADGGSTEQRVFVVRRAGYVDRAVTVDLAGTQREFQVALGHADPSAARPRDPRADARDGADRHPARRPARPAKQPGRGDVAPDPRAEPAAPTAQPEAHPAKKPPPIDPTDTLDPFRKK
ncbi:MAG TPA: protein kinase [Kofleriaceae bacterium]|jgi:serine/threonine-protein kinase|nr:protein kinase [Kofleriaceae bacterium]